MDIIETGTDTIDTFSGQGNESPLNYAWAATFLRPIQPTKINFFVVSGRISWSLQ